MVELDKRTIFWDFDGVIKDSVEVKSDAFEQLFLTFGREIAKKVRRHHEANGGMSRFDKLPLYLKWAGQALSPLLVDKYAQQFSLLVTQRVIDSEWVDGALEYLQSNHNRQQFFLITSTPQKEIENIISQLQIADYFQQVIGSPATKGEAIQSLLNWYNINPEQAVMIGDSSSDYNAATDNNIAFVLRKTELNKDLQDQLKCAIIKNFL